MSRYLDIDSATKYIVCGWRAAHQATVCEFHRANDLYRCSPYLCTPRLPPRPYTRLLRFARIWEGV
jgi:hypothetical protein